MIKKPHNTRGCFLKPVLLLFAIILALCFSGCAKSAGPDVTQSSPAGSPSFEAEGTDKPPATPKPTPVRTTTPDVTPSQQAASPSPKPSAKPSVKPTKKPEKDDGKVVIAEGFYYVKLDDDLKKRITGMSYPEDDSGCQVKYSDLRYVKIKHYDFNGKVKEGELVVNRKVAKDVAQIFYELYQKEYALASVRLVDDFGQPGSDSASMAANNSSAYCYRRVTGSKRMSHHSFGAAVDINPVFNPYVNGDRVSPKNSVPYLDRTKDFEGKIDHDDLCFKLFKKHGWKWGGDFKNDPDYQHFYKDSLGYDRHKP